MLQVDAKRLIIQEVIKKGTELYSQQEIVFETGLEQSLVSYHLTKLCKDSIINKLPGKRGKYRTIDQPALLGMFVSEKTRAVTIKPKLEWLSPTVKETLETLRALRTFGYKGQKVLEEQKLNEIDVIIEEANAMKRWFRESTPKAEQAYETLKNKLEELLEQHEILQHYYSAEDWKEKIVEIRLLNKDKAEHQPKKKQQFSSKMPEEISAGRNRILETIQREAEAAGITLQEAILKKPEGFRKAFDLERYLNA